MKREKWLPNSASAAGDKSGNNNSFLMSKKEGDVWDLPCSISPINREMKEIDN